MAASDKSVVVSSATDFSSDSTASDDWQELTKSDYAKVIFSDLLCNAALGTVECKFQITDNVHEDPNDYVGLFRIGYEDLSQCLVSKMLSQTKCEDDGKLQRCVFTSEELPRLTDGFYQFLYVTRDREVCGASMPFQIKMSPKESSTDSSISEAMDGGFLLVSNETERKMKEEPSKKGEALAQRNTLSEQKEEEIAAWVSQNPDYYSLIEQIREHTFTIDALQQSKDLAMKEVVQLYGVLNSQKSEVAQLKNMLDAYKEKVKMSQCVQDEKNNELIQTRNVLASCKEKMCKDLSLQEEKDITIAEMKKSLAVYEEKVKSYEQLQKEKEEEINQLKRELLQQEEKLKMSYSYQNQLQIEIRTLNKENVEMKEKQAAKQCQQIAAETGRHPIDSVIQKAQDFVCLISDTIRNLDYTDEVERQKYYALKIEVLVMLKKMQNYLYWSEPDFEKMGIKGRSGTTSCAFENRAPVETAVTSALNITVPEVEKADEPTSSAQTLPPLNSNEKEPTNEDTSKEAVQRSSIDKVFESEVLEHQIIELPRLEVIDEDMAKTLQINKSLDAEDIIAVNRLTENMIKRGFNLYEAIEQVDDFASDSESDISEISECSSSIKKDMLCVFKVLEAVSSHLSDQTELYHLIVFGKEEDKNQINSNKLELLRKCALRYHIELLLEHIDKQKEGIKKVSEKICDLLTKYMLLKDEMGESKALCEKLKSELHSKDTKICSLKGELDFVKTLLGHFQEKSEKFKDKAELAEKSVEEFRARIEEASSLYKEQYIEIDKLQRRLRKYKSMKDKVKSSKGEFSLISSDSSKTGSSFEVVKKDSNQKINDSVTAGSSFEVAKEDSNQNINDSDTGEHMFEKAPLVSKKKNQVPRASTVDAFPVYPYFQKEFKGKGPWHEEPCFSESTEAHRSNDMRMMMIRKSSERFLNTFPAIDHIAQACASNDMLPSNPDSKSEELTAHAIDDKPNTESVECKSNQSSSLFSEFASYEHFQEVIKESFTNIQRPSTLRNSQECSISCYFCKEIKYLGPEAPVDLMNHLENEHSMKMCPVCGQLFEDAIPPKYFHIHVEQHFETQ